MRIGAFLAASLALLGGAFLASAQETAEKTARSVPQRTLRVTATLLAKGELRPSTSTAPGDKLPIEINGRLEFSERPLPLAAEDSALYRAIRHYDRADATIKLPDSSQATSLSKSRRLIGVEVGENLSVYSPQGPLTRDDLELISTQGDLAAVSAILAEHEIKTGAAWQPNDQAMALLLGLDEVDRNELECTVDSVKNGVVHLRLTGKLDGKAEGAKSKIELSGTIDWDQTQNFARQLKLSINETREAGQGTPGFALRAEIRADAIVVATPKELSPPALSGVALLPGETERLLDFAAETSGFQLCHDRRWRVVVHKRDSVVLRMIHGGDLIGQCNIASLPTINGDTPMELEKFRRAVESALAKHGAKIDEASRATTDAGVEILRIAATGLVEEVPVHWLYYHLSDKSGRRAALVFTVEDRFAKDFAAADHLLVGNFKFTGEAASATANSGEQPPAQPQRTSARPVESTER